MNRPRSPKQKKLSMGVAVPLGVVLGTAIGFAIDNMPVGIGGGIAIAMLLTFVANSQAR